METQQIILFLANYIEQGLDRETANVLERELNYHPKAILFLMSYGATLSFYKRHLNNDMRIEWIVDYLDRRIPRSLRQLLRSLSYRRPLR
jgi:hypothetical protein